MPIPPFDGILNVLPPHLGDPRKRADLSPYECTMKEVCTQFATSSERMQILRGFLKLRAELFALGVKGYQWLDGSFMEEIEVQERRNPKDIDVVTFVTEPIAPVDLKARIIPRRDLWIPDESKRAYFVDHYLISLGSPPALLIEDTKYWYALFSHRRGVGFDRVWKGMLVVNLVDPSDDDAAGVVLGGTP